MTDSSPGPLAGWPDDEEIKPAVLDYLQTLLGVSTMDLYYLLGSGRAAARRTRKTPAGRTVVADPAMALLVRYYLRFPDVARQLVPPVPHPKEVFDQLNAGCDEGDYRVSKRRFALLLGRNATFPTEAFRSHTRPTGLLSRLLLAISQDIRMRGPVVALKNLEAFSESEMRIRELPFVNDAGTWIPTSQQKRRRAPARPAAHSGKPRRQAAARPRTESSGVSRTRKVQDGGKRRKARA